MNTLDSILDDLRSRLPASLRGAYLDSYVQRRRTPMELLLARSLPDVGASATTFEDARSEIYALKMPQWVENRYLSEIEQALAVGEDTREVVERAKAWMATSIPATAEADACHVCSETGKKSCTACGTEIVPYGAQGLACPKCAEQEIDAADGDVAAVEAKASRHEPPPIPPEGPETPLHQQDPDSVDVLNRLLAALSEVFIITPIRSGHGYRVVDLRSKSTDGVFTGLPRNTYLTTVSLWHSKAPEFIGDKAYLVQSIRDAGRSQDQHRAIRRFMVETVERLAAEAQGKVVEDEPEDETRAPPPPPNPSARSTQAPDTAKIADRVRKLLALAERAGTPEEAGTAYATAQRLIAQHALSEEQLRQARLRDTGLRANEPIVMAIVYVSPVSQMPTWIGVLGLCLAQTNGCELAQGHGPRREVVLKAWGRPSDLALVEELLRVVPGQIDALCDRSPFTGRTARNNFRIGAVTVVCERLRAAARDARLAIEQAAAQTDTSASAPITALALVALDNRNALAKGQMYRDCPNLRAKTSSFRGDHAARDAGRAAGATMNVSRQRAIR